MNKVFLIGLYAFICALCLDIMIRYPGLQSPVLFGFLVSILTPLAKEMKITFVIDSEKHKRILPRIFKRKPPKIKPPKFKN